MSSAVNRQSIVTLDLEGVLVPEIWIAVAERTGIDALRRTTRDEPDYDVLMKYRLGSARRARPHDVADRRRDRRARRRSPAPRTFLDELARPHAGRHPLGHLRAVRGAADAPARVGRRSCAIAWSSTTTGSSDYRLRMPDQKRHAVERASAPQLPGDRGRRLLQRHHDARSPPTPGSCSTRPPNVRRRVPAVPRPRRLRRAPHRHHRRADLNPSNRMLKFGCRAGVMAVRRPSRRPPPVDSLLFRLVKGLRLDTAS